MLGKLKPFLTTAVISVLAVILYNKFVAGRFNTPSA